MARGRTARSFAVVLRSARYGAFVSLDAMGKGALQYVGKVTFTLSVIAGAVMLFPRNVFWNRAIREVFMRQMLFTAIDGTRMAVSMGFSVGIILIVQAAKWLSEYGGSFTTIAPFLLGITVREVAPLIANLLVIGRSGIAISTEMANMRVLGEIDVLEGQGIDPMTYLVMPRVIATSLSIFSLALIVLVAMYSSAYLVGYWTNAISENFWDFTSQLLKSLSFYDALCFFAKTIVTGLFIGSIVTTEGLKAGRVATDVPRLASSSGVAALTAYFVVNAILSLLLDKKILIWEVL
jgi:phospholipid/cholesterol/gamma-HCH transport system permease protein